MPYGHNYGKPKVNAPKPKTNKPKQVAKKMTLKKSTRRA